MNTTVVHTSNSLAASSPDTANSNANNMEQVEIKLGKGSKKSWIDTISLEIPNVLDPDDSLMKRFQDALREHLARVDDRLSSEIVELVSIIRTHIHVTYMYKGLRN